MILYRPTGLDELRLVLAAELRAWPPRLPEQPIFYPVLNREYAVQIARDWNTKTDWCVGYVTRFEIDDAYAARFERKVVGGRRHEELWVPAEELEELNRHLLGPIRVTDAFYGKRFPGLTTDVGVLRERGPDVQLTVFAQLYEEGSWGEGGEVENNRDIVFLTLPYWESLPDKASLWSTTSEVVRALREAWKRWFPHLPPPEVGGGGIVGQG